MCTWRAPICTVSHSVSTFWSYTVQPKAHTYCIDVQYSQGLFEKVVKMGQKYGCEKGAAVRENTI